MITEATWNAMSDAERTSAVERVPLTHLIAAGIDPADILCAAQYDIVDELSAVIPGSAVIEGCLVLRPDTIHADDGNAEVEYQGLDSAEAAQQYVDEGGWNDNDGNTFWVRVQTWREGLDADGDAVRVEERGHTIAVEPDEPDCEDGHDHDWQSPYSVLGGLKENPGVWGKGGGVIIKEVCRHCGKYRIRDTWAQDMTTGEQGLESTRYEDADEASMEWAQSSRDEEAIAEVKGS